MKKLVEVLLGHRRTRNFQLGENKVVLQTITSREQSEISRAVSGLDLIAQIENLKVPLLARSLVSINDTQIENFPEVREQLRKFSGNGAEGNQNVVVAIEQSLYEMEKDSINLLYSCYLDLEKERVDERDKLKNSLRAQSAESSGKSAPVSEPVQAA